MALRGTTKELGMLFVFHRDENGQVDETPVAVVSDPIGYRNYDECSVRTWKNGLHLAGNRKPFSVINK